MAERRTSKKRTVAGGVESASASPTGHEEIAEYSASEKQGTAEPPDAPQRKTNPPVHTVDMPQNRNPKHTGRTPRNQ